MVVQQLERQIKLANEKLARQVQSGEEMRQQAKEEMDQLKAESVLVAAMHPQILISMSNPLNRLYRYAAKAKERTVTLREVDSRRADKKMIEDEMRKFREEQKKQLDSLTAEYASVRDAMGEPYHISDNVEAC